MAVEFKNKTLEAIFAAYERDHKPWIRQHVGASDIGNRCDRATWYNFHHVRPEGEKFDGRKLRLFQTGHREEARLVADLRAAGMEVFDREDGKQIEYTAIGGHLVVHLDGVVLGVPEAPKTPHLLEVKTSNKKNFDKLGNEKDPTKRGVKINKPEHYDQMQLCMGLADLTRALYVVHCKDTDEIYCERIDFDPKRFKELMDRARHIIYSDEAPERLNKDPAFYYCQHFCSLTELCHGNKWPAKNCRTCVHSEPKSGGEWSCNRDKPMEPGCDAHLFRPSMIDQFATPIDGDPTWIKYRVNATGVEFVNTAADGFPAQDCPTYESAELVNVHPLQIGNEAIEKARTILGGKVESMTSPTDEQLEGAGYLATGMLSVNETFE